MEMYYESPFVDELAKHKEKAKAAAWLWKIYICDKLLSEEIVVPWKLLTFCVQIFQHLMIKHVLVIFIAYLYFVNCLTSTKEHFYTVLYNI
jgi:hypothetical protein